MLKYDWQKQNKMEMIKIFYVYMLQCSDDSLYTGYTNDLSKRIRSHNEGKASKYTRAKLPVKLTYFEEYGTKSEAMKREIEIKKLKRDEKIKLITLIELKGE